MLRRPAARVRVRRPALRGAGQASEEWIDISEKDMSEVRLGTLLMVELSYEGERGLMFCSVLDRVEDELGHWLGVNVKGTNISGLRHWKLQKRGTAGRLYISQERVEEGSRILQEALGYTERFKVVAERPGDPWTANCEDVPGVAGVMAETEDLRKAAQDLGLAGEGAAAVPAPPDIERADPPRGALPSGSSNSKRKRVRTMVANARCSARDTPLDPSYRREVSLKIKRKRRSSSSGTGSSVSSDSSQGIGDEHQLKAIAKKLPGYLARRSAKEALEALAQACGESPESYQVFLRYYRQVIANRGGPKPLLREMLTLSFLMDTMLKGEVLHALDIVAQRLKSLELLQQGAEETWGASWSCSRRRSQLWPAIPRPGLRGQKLKKQLWDRNRPPPPPGGWKGKAESPGGKAKGKKGDGKDPKGKGEKGKESKVVKVDS